MKASETVSVILPHNGVQAIAIAPTTRCTRATVHEHEQSELELVGGVFYYGGEENLPRAAAPIVAIGECKKGETVFAELFNEASGKAMAWTRCTLA